jgi:hypothetical protein
LRRSHIVDYSIHLLPSPPYASSSTSSDLTTPQTASEPIGGLLIATFKYIGDDFEADMKRAAEDAETRKWWKITDKMQSSLIFDAKGSEHGPWWLDCEEVFRFEQ